MGFPGRSATIVRITASLVVAFASLALASEGPPRSAPKASSSEGTIAIALVPSVRISGHVKGLYPGGMKKLRAHVRNPGSFAVLVDRVSAAAGKTGEGCGPKFLKLRRSHRTVRIPAHGHRTVKLEVTLRPGAPSACQGAIFPLSFHARVKAA